MAVERITLLSNASATGNPAAVPVAGYYQFMVSGTIGGATVKLQILGPDSSTYVDVGSSSLTAAGTVAVPLPAGSLVKAAVSGGTPSALYAAIDLCAD